MPKGDEGLTLRMELLIQTTVPQLWEALVNPEVTEKYMFGLRVYSDWKTGSPILWKGNYEGRELIHKGVILKLEAGRLLQITDFDLLGKLEDVPENYTIVTQELIGEKEMTRLKITEEHFGGDENRLKDAAGFWDSTLPKLKALLEKGAP